MKKKFIVPRFVLNITEDEECFFAEGGATQPRAGIFIASIECQACPPMERSCNVNLGRS